MATTRMETTHRPTSSIATVKGDRVLSSAWDNYKLKMMTVAQTLQ